MRIQDLLATELVPREGKEESSGDEEPGDPATERDDPRAGDPAASEDDEELREDDMPQETSPQDGVPQEDVPDDGQNPAEEPPPRTEPEPTESAPATEAQRSGHALKARALAALLASAAFAGCGASDSEDALNETASKLGEIRSGQLDMKLVVSPSTARSDIGFELEGPFSLADKGELPTTDLRYRQIAGDKRGDVQFVSTKNGAWVKVKGQAYELPPDRVAGLVGDGGDGGGPLAELDLASWARDPELDDGPAVAGDETERVRSEVDVVKALNDLLGTLGDLGAGEAAGLGPLEAEDARQFEDAIRSSRLEVLTGKEDRLLRRMALHLDIGVKARELAGGLGRLSGADVTLELKIADPNGTVRVREPKDALPYTSLPQGSLLRLHRRAARVDQDLRVRVGCAQEPRTPVPRRPARQCR